MRPPFRVAALFRYPLKSAAGEPCREVELDRFGVREDRRWMIVDRRGNPVTQREAPLLSRLRARRIDEELELSWPEGSAGLPGSTFRVAPPSRTAPRLPITIWGDHVHLPLADDEASGRVSALLGYEVRLAYMPGDVERPVNPRYAAAGDRTSLTDGYPLHLVGSGSLADLNARLEESVGIERFRPNVYVEGTPAFDEDDWSEIRVGDCRLRVVKPCPRCAVTTVDPETGTRGKEPLRTLSSYRKREGGVMFGQNALHDGEGVLRVGDPVEVLSRRGAPAA